MIQEKQTTFFQKLKKGLARTRDTLRVAFSGVTTLEEGFYDELEEALIMSDLGVYTAEELIEELKRVTYESVDSCDAQNIIDYAAIKSRVKSNISGYLYKSTRRSPMILPVISEV